MRRRNVLPAVRQTYLARIAGYCQEQRQLPALEAFVASLSAASADDYRTLGLFLLRAYRAQPGQTAAVQRWRTALQAPAARDPDLADQLRYLAVREHLAADPRALAPADTATLRTTVRAAAPDAEAARQLLRYFYPRLALPAAPPPANRNRSAGGAAGPAPAWLRGLHPNPAAATLTLTYAFPATTQQAEARFYDLLGGQLRRTVTLPGGRGQEATQAVSLAGLPAGQYSCVLVADGLPAAPLRLVVLP